MLHRHMDFACNLRFSVEHPALLFVPITPYGGVERIAVYSKREQVAMIFGRGWSCENDDYTLMSVDATGDGQDTTGDYELRTSRLVEIAWMLSDLQQSGLNWSHTAACQEAREELDAELAD